MVPGPHARIPSCLVGDNAGFVPRGSHAESGRLVGKDEHVFRDTTDLTSVSRDTIACAQLRLPRPRAGLTLMALVALSPQRRGRS